MPDGSCVIWHFFNAHVKEMQEFAVNRMYCHRSMCSSFFFSCVSLNCIISHAIHMTITYTQYLQHLSVDEPCLFNAFSQANLYYSSFIHVCEKCALLVLFLHLITSLRRHWRNFMTDHMARPPTSLLSRCLLRETVVKASHSLVLHGIKRK